jgi:hypothetical protein
VLGVSSYIADRRETGKVCGLAFAASTAPVMRAAGRTTDLLLIARLASMMDLMDSGESFENVLKEVTSNLTRKAASVPA